ncbi:MAG: alpha/beta fold hydrolase [Verrucomicrobiota bacterium]
MPAPLPNRAPRKRLCQRLLKIGLILCLFFGLALWAITRVIAPPMIVEPPRSGTDAQVPDGMELLNFELEDGTSLTAWRKPLKTEVRSVIIILHGIGDSKASHAGTLNSLAQRGIEGIAVDLRAHGQSGGLASYGYHERHDISLIIDSCKQRHPEVSIGIWGISYGGAVAIQACAEDARLDFAIIESTFANLTDMARQQVSNSGASLLSWIAPLALDRAGELANFDPGLVSPEKAVRSVKASVLHFHGTRDELIPFDHGQRISDNGHSDRHRFVPIEGAGHYDIPQVDPERYHAEISDFLDQVTRVSS